METNETSIMLTEIIDMLPARIELTSTDGESTRYFYLHIMKTESGYTSCYNGMFSGVSLLSEKDKEFSVTILRLYLQCAERKYIESDEGKVKEIRALLNQHKGPITTEDNSKNETLN